MIHQIKASTACAVLMFFLAGQVPLVGQKQEPCCKSVELALAAMEKDAKRLAAGKLLPEEVAVAHSMKTESNFSRAKAQLEKKTNREALVRVRMNYLDTTNEYTTIVHVRREGGWLWWGGRWKVAP